MGYQDWNFGVQNNYLNDMHMFQPQYSFGASEVSNEYNLLNDFLTNSMLEDGGMYPQDDTTGLYQNEQSFPSSMQTFNNEPLLAPPQANQGHQVSHSNQMLPPPQAAIGNAISRPASAVPSERAQEAFYRTAADPAGDDSPETRLRNMLKAKFEAGLLKPYNYAFAYRPLLEHMSKNLQPPARLRILKQMDRIRPIFRERMHKLTDVQLVLVEINFERTLMEYDRVFASMATPACCWRRTGGIYRGNNEMAKLLGVSTESLRDVHLLFLDIALCEPN